VLTKEQLVRELDSQLFKLSDFIDKQFIDSCLAPVDRIPESAEISKKPLSDWLQLKQQPTAHLFTGGAKRQKQDRDGTQKYVLLSPTLAILLSFTSKINNQSWEVRQVASCGLSILLENLKD
jgi:hypothetical protein